MLVVNIDTAIDPNLNLEFGKTGIYSDYDNYNNKLDKFLELYTLHFFYHLEKFLKVLVQNYIHLKISKYC